MIYCCYCLVTSHVWLFMTLWTTACQAFLSFTVSQSLLKLMSIELVMPSHHFNLCHPLLLLPSVFPSIRVFSNESAFRIRWPKCWSLSSASVLPVNIQGWFPLGLTGLISLQSKGLSRVFSAPQFKSINSLALSLLQYRRPRFNSWVGKIPLQYFCLENPMVREDWQAIVHRVSRVQHNLVTSPPAFFMVQLSPSLS